MGRMALSNFFAEMVASYHAADFDRVAEVYLLPGAIYFGEDVIVLHDRPRLMSMMREQCARNHQMGVRTLRVDIVAQTLSRSNNYSVWADWQHFDADGVLLYTVSVRYVCRDDASGVPQIQLIELLDRPQCFSEREMLEMAEPRRKQRAS